MGMALKRITFRADAKAIERARRVAKSEGTTLQEEFRKWLDDYIAGHWIPPEGRRIRKK